MSAKVLARILLALTSLAAVAITAVPAHSAAVDPLAGGVTTGLAPGVTLTELTTGSDASYVWTVHVYVPADPNGPIDTANTGLGPQPTAERVAGCLTGQGIHPTGRGGRPAGLR